VFGHAKSSNLLSCVALSVDADPKVRVESSKERDFSHQQSRDDSWPYVELDYASELVSLKTHPAEIQGDVSIACLFHRKVTE
jgi:hypothetical protein